MRVRILRPDLAIFVEAIFAKTLIGLLIVVREIQVVFDQWCAGVGVVADAIPADPRIQQGKAQNKNDKQDPTQSVAAGFGFENSRQINPERNARS